MTGVNGLENMVGVGMGFGGWGIPNNQSWNIDGYTNRPISLLHALTIFSQNQTKSSKYRALSPSLQPHREQSLYVPISAHNQQHQMIV